MPRRVLTTSYDDPVEASSAEITNRIRMARRLFRKATVLTHPTPARQDALFHRQGRSKRRGEAYSLPYVEPLSAARTPLADFVNRLLGTLTGKPRSAAVAENRAQD
jgi:hypothetical protein